MSFDYKKLSLLSMSAIFSFLFVSCSLGGEQSQGTPNAIQNIYSSSGACEISECGLSDAGLVKYLNAHGVKSLERDANGSFFSSDTKGNSTDLLRMENHRAESGATAEFVADDVHLRYGADYSIVSATRSKSPNGTQSGNQAADFLSAAMVIRKCSPGFESLQKCVEKTGLTIAYSKTFLDQFWKEWKMDEVLAASTDQEKTEKATMFFEEKGTSLMGANPAPEVSENIENVPGYVGKKVFEFMK